MGYVGKFTYLAWRKTTKLLVQSVYVGAYQL